MVNQIGNGFAEEEMGPATKCFLNLSINFLIFQEELHHILIKQRETI
jgi:hypothetical protein